MLSRRQFTASAAAAFQRPRRPNILFVLPDQLRAQALGCMGNTVVQTPNIDRLAGEGVTFRNTIANTPVCCPARAIFLTGQYCHTNGMVANDLRLRESSVTLPSLLKQHGYRTGFVGKWHIDGGPRLPGFVPPGPRRHGYDFWAANECSHEHFKNTYFRDTPQPLPVRGFEPEGWTDLALEFLETTKRDARPFFLSVFMGPPHDPYAAPDAYMRRYEGVPKPLNAYYAAITAIDDQIARLTRSLSDLGLAEDTIVLFSSDHGDMLGTHGAKLKRKPWEESIRVPGILRYPRRIKPGRSEEALLSHVDYAPTLLSLCGVPVPATMQGADLSGLVTGQNRRAPDSAFLQIFGPYAGDQTPAGWRGLRTDRYKYARFEDKPWVLYDLKEDPKEEHNLAEDASAAKLRQTLESQLEAWMRRTGDSWKYNWTAPVEDAGRLYKDKTYYSVDDYLKEHPQ